MQIVYRIENWGMGEKGLGINNYKNAVRKFLTAQGFYFVGSGDPTATGICGQYP
jgi:hypothetical protein